MFEVFARPDCPRGRGRYGVVRRDRAGASTRSPDFRFDAGTIAWLRAQGIIDEPTGQFPGLLPLSAATWDGYPEGELYFPYSPLLTVSGTFAEAVVLETRGALDPQSRLRDRRGGRLAWVTAAGGRPIIEMGLAAAPTRMPPSLRPRASYLAGFASTSNLSASARLRHPDRRQPPRIAFVLLHDDEQAAFTAQLDSLGAATTLLIDTYDITRGDRAGGGRRRAGTRRDPHRLRRSRGDGPPRPGPAGRTGRHRYPDRGQRATSTSSPSPPWLRPPVDVYGAGTAVVTGSGAPTAGLVYKLVEVDGRPVAKRSEHKQSLGGRKTAPPQPQARPARRVEEIIIAGADGPEPEDARELQIPLLRRGAPVADLPSLAQGREHLRAATVSLPWDGFENCPAASRRSPPD